MPHPEKQHVMFDLLLAIFIYFAGCKDHRADCNEYANWGYGAWKCIFKEINKGGGGATRVITLSLSIIGERKEILKVYVEIESIFPFLPGLEP